MDKISKEKRFILLIALILLLINFLGMFYLAKKYGSDFFYNLSLKWSGVESNLPFKSFSKNLWVRPDGSKPNLSDMTNCLSIIFSEPSCQGGIVGYVKCRPCSNDGSGICVEIGGLKSSVGWNSSSTCRQENCLSSPPVCNERQVNQDLTVYQGKPNILQWGAPDFTGPGCRWKKDNGSLPTGQVGDCLVRLYSEENCQGIILGYNNCGPKNKCSDEGKGICVELGQLTKVSFQSADISQTIPAGKNCSLSNFNREELVSSEYHYLKWRCDK